MKRMFIARAAILAAAAGATLTLTARAEAADCAFAPGTVFTTGSSAAKPVIKSIAITLAAATPPVNVVYVGSESCDGVQTITNNTPTTATATYWPAGVETTCTFPAGTSQAIDVGVSDVFVSSCPNASLPATQKDFHGPIQSMVFITHPTSNENSISYEAGHAILKYVGTGQYALTPWSDVNNIFIRPGGSTSSGTRAMMGKAVGLLDGEWKGTVKTSSDNVISAVSGAQAAANASLGILSSPKADPIRPGSAAPAPVKQLAFQGKGQSCGYLPDSSATSFDKINVREGRYQIWGPIHFITNVDGTGKPISKSTPTAGDSAVQTFINYVTLPIGTSPLSFDQKKAMIDATVGAHAIAQCAMKVRRTDEVGPEASFVPAEPCGCYWESKANGAAPASCHACQTDNDCTGQSGATKCRYNFCEAQ